MHASDGKLRFTDTEQFFRVNPDQPDQNKFKVSINEQSLYS